MSISGITENEYALFLENGGIVRIILDKSDINCESDFENSEEIIPYLYSGFEIPPSTDVVNDPANRSIVYLYAAPWDRTVIYVYAYGGKIVYKKINNDKYEAEVILPKRT